MSTLCANRTLLHATPSLLPGSGGLALAAAQLCNAICRANSEVRLALISRDFSGRPVAPIANDIQVLKVAHEGGFEPPLQAFQAKTPADLIHQHGIWLPSMHAVSTFARRKRVPLVLSVHGMLHPTVLRHHFWRKKIDMFKYQGGDLKRAAALHASTETEAAHLRAQRLRQPILLIPEGGALPAAEQCATHTEDKRERSLLCIARRGQSQPLESLLRAWIKLSPPDWRLRILDCDDEALLHHLQRLSTELRAGASVEVSGPLFGLARQHAFRSADLFILPANGEAFEKIAAEGIAHGLPVLTRAGVFSTELEQEGCGWLAPTDAAIVEVLEQAIALTPAERAAMGKKARTLFERKYQWPAVARTMLDCYAWLLGETPTRPDCVLEA